MPGEAVAWLGNRDDVLFSLADSSMVTSPDKSSVFDVLLGLVRLGLSGTEGGGRQYLSWMYGADSVRSLYWLMEHELAGAVNIASPNPLPNAVFLRDFREAWGTKLGLPATEWMLTVGTFVLRSETELVLKSRRVVPTRLPQDGFQFEYPGWPEAAQDLCRKWRTQA